MSVTWFMIKCLIVTFVLMSLLQLKIGSNNNSLETYFKNWMVKLSASKRIQNVAEGGQQISSQVVREFTTEDGTTVYLASPKKPERAQSNSYIEMDGSGQTDKIIIKDNSFFGRIISGFKSQVSEDSISFKDELKKEVQKEMIKEMDQRMKKSGLEDQTFEKQNN